MNWPAKAQSGLISRQNRTTGASIQKEKAWKTMNENYLIKLHERCLKELWSYQMTMHLPDILYFHVNCINLCPIIQAMYKNEG